MSCDLRKSSSGLRLNNNIIFTLWFLLLFLPPRVSVLKPTHRSSRRRRLSQRQARLLLVMVQLCLSVWLAGTDNWFICNYFWTWHHTYSKGYDLQNTRVSSCMYTHMSMCTGFRCHFTHSSFLPSISCYLFSFTYVILFPSLSLMG